MSSPSDGCTVVPGQQPCPLVRRALASAASQREHVRVLLALGSQALLALVGQTQVAQPEAVFPAVVARLRQESERERQRQLLTALLALITEEEGYTWWIARWS